MFSIEFQITLFLWGVTLLILLLIIFIILITSLYQKKQINYYLNIEQIKVNHTNTLLATKLEIQEQTFLDISRSIHDNIGQKLSLVKLNLIGLNNHIVDKNLTNTIRIVEDTIVDLKQISRNLDSELIMKDGLIKALEHESIELRNTNEFTVDLYINGQTYFLKNDIELVLFRISQEAINNIIKHSHANKIEISLTFDAKFIELKIGDNGDGFDCDYNASKTPAGSGLKNMRSRANALNGSCSLESFIGKGTTITIKIPSQHEQRN